jgi:hypothetical protein
VWSCRDGGEHHTESLKLSKADERFRFRRGLLAPEMVRAGPSLDGGLPAWAARGAGGAHFPYLPREKLAKLGASAGVTDVTGCS